jgi:gluconate 2-dehydrogenase gamma chain
MNRREALKHTAFLLGVSLSPSAVSSALAQLSRDPSAGPVHLTAPRFAAAAALAERLLPRTDTPGAADAGVPGFFDVSYGTFMNEAERTVVERGLDQLNAAGPQGYAALPPQRQDELIRALAASSEQDRRFLREMRQTIFTGYFTSERVCNEVFKHDPIPGRYKSDVSLQEATGGVAWSE